MIVVSDTSPLNYLVQIGKVEILPQMFGQIVIPQAVHEELSHDRAPSQVRDWLSDPPVWLDVRDAPSFQEEAGLDRGEAEAIALARSLDPPVLIDDRRGREYASERDVLVIGTIGVIDRAARRGVLDYVQNPARACLHELPHCRKSTLTRSLSLTSTRTKWTEPAHLQGHKQKAPRQKAAVLPFDREGT